jgi:hypothetical protein
MWVTKGPLYGLGAEPVVQSSSSLSLSPPEAPCAARPVLVVRFTTQQRVVNPRQLIVLNQ